MAEHAHEHPLHEEIDEVKVILREQVKAHMEQKANKGLDISPFVYVEALLAEATSILSQAVQMPLLDDSAAPDEKFAGVQAIAASEAFKEVLLEMFKEAGEKELPAISVILGTMAATLHPLHDLNHQYHDLKVDDDVPGPSLKSSQQGAPSNLKDALTDFLKN